MLHTLQLECETLTCVNMYIKAKVLFRIGSFERLYVLNLVPNVGFRNISVFFLIWWNVASSPGLRGEGKGRPGTHCMRMRHYSPDFGESGYVWILSVYLHRKLHVFKVMMSVSHIDAT